MDPDSFRIDFDRLDWQIAAPGCRYKAIIRGKQQMRLLELTAGFVEAGWCNKGHTGLVLEGELEIDFQGRVTRFAKGSSVHIPAGADSAHKARALGGRVTLFLVEDL